ncbi:hypothetical protein PUN28_013006 [Cardiocondyla obscurior]|uniref:Uncharacterized protein n=1 Tax=Cardiocondyla obscurior TaxID=286306 RepID=A0AAW2F6I1_9HYME
MLIIIFHNFNVFAHNSFFFLRYLASVIYYIFTFNSTVKFITDLHAGKKKFNYIEYIKKLLKKGRKSTGETSAHLCVSVFF